MACLMQKSNLFRIKAGMKKFADRLLISILFGQIFLISCNMGTYYIDSEKGDDLNTGKSKRNAWATAEKLNELHLQQGNKILFRGGQTLKANIHLKNVKGTAEENITISSYGKDTAIIDGQDSLALLLDSCAFVSIKNINFKGSGRKSGNTASGVIIQNSKNISVDKAEISGFQKAGLKISDSENITGTQVYAFENGFAGILTGETYYKPFELRSKNIYIGYCTVENNPGDHTVLDNHSGNGIVISGTDSAVVEYCLAKNNGWDQPWEGNGPVGIWAFHSNNVIIQHCISYSNKSNPKGWDGGGFDLDGGVTNSVMQYNLSYNNDGPGYGLYQYWGAVPWENNIVRYNISINDGTKHDSCGLHVWNGQPDKPTFQNAQIYNNVFYNDFGRAVDYKSGDIPGLIYINNVFVSRQQPVTGIYSKSKFDNNLYCRLENKPVDMKVDPNAIFANPMLVLPENISLEIPSELYNTNLFKPLENSPVIGSGIALPVANDKDFGGKPVSNEIGKINIGVWQN